MATNKDWLPRSHTSLYQQVVLTWNYLLAPGNRARMGFAPDSTQGVWFDTVFAPAFNDYGAAYVAWINPADRTPGIITKLEEAEAVLKAEYRKLYTGTLKDSPVVTNFDLQEMGLPKRHTGGNTPAPVATEAPDCDVDTSVPGRVTFHFYGKGEAGKKAKPAGQHGVELGWDVSEVAPSRWEDLRHSAFDTHTPLTLSFE
ncbi:MAG: hypothetical protein LBU42_01780, partial [Prevotellaceae bacterium]|nr:hypothetical protein [Prevotellaceae bacterium]